MEPTVNDYLGKYGGRNQEASRIRGCSKGEDV